jgi:hypothetical protein
MSRTTLQALAKEQGFKANAETADLVKTLQDSHKSVCKTFALKLDRMQHILVHNEIGVEGAEKLRRVLTSIRDRQEEERFYNEDYSHGPCETFGQKGHGVDWLAGVLVQCPALACILLTSISATIRSDHPGH